MTQKKLKCILIPCFSVAIATAIVVPAACICNTSRIKIKYTDYGTTKSIAETFNLPFILNDKLQDNEKLDFDFYPTYIGPGLSNVRKENDTSIVVTNNDVCINNLHIDIDGSKIKDDLGSFVNLVINFKCIDKTTNRILWTDTIRKIYLNVGKR